MDTTLALHAPEARQEAEQVGEAQGPAQVAPPPRRAVVEAARAYAARGWFPLPLPVGAKGPPPDGWAEAAREADWEPMFAELAELRARKTPEVIADATAYKAYHRDFNAAYRKWSDLRDAIKQEVWLG